MADLIDSRYFEQLSSSDPKDICQSAICEYDGISKRYHLIVWDEEYEVDPAQSTIICTSNKTLILHEYLYLFMIYYLLNANQVNISGQWISEKDMPGGATFFRGPHELPTGLITGRCNNTHQFRQRCKELNGIPLDMADAAFSFKITPRIPVAVLYWEGDDDFPAESKILYDRTILDHLSIDIIYSMAVGICERVGQTD